MPGWVEAVERAYVAAGTGDRVTARDGDRARARAAIGAVASHYLAVGSPRSLGLIASADTVDEAALSLAAHRAWFAPRELRCTGSDALAAVTGATTCSLAEVLASDIVCVHRPLALRRADLRRGTHVNVLAAGSTLDDELRAFALVHEEDPGLAALAAGLVDGRALDELTVFIAGDLAIALAALASLAA